MYSIAQTKVSWESLAAGVKKTCRNLKKREWVFLSQLILLFAIILYILKQVHYVAFKLKSLQIFTKNVKYFLKHETLSTSEKGRKQLI